MVSEHDHLEGNPERITVHVLFSPVGPQDPPGGAGGYGCGGVGLNV